MQLFDPSKSGGVGVLRPNYQRCKAFGDNGEKMWLIRHRFANRFRGGLGVM
jgi:hypothetical protein